jgi:pimeloyl-ACP methyl ester carboxylesterase
VSASDIGSDFATAADGVRIAYRAHGAADAPALLFCSMGTAAMSVWDPVANPLAERWRVVLHDRRGDGDSDPGAPERHRFETYAADALAVLDHLHIERAAACGMAFGARVAMRLPLAAPERIRGLVLFDATGGPPAPEAERRAGNARAAKLRAEAGLPETPKPDPRWFHRRDPSGAGLSRHAFEGQPAWLPGLAAIATPTLVACGDCDPNLPGARRVAAEIPGARFELMPMTGHASILERPDLIFSLIQEFMEQFAS